MNGLYTGPLPDEWADLHGTFTVRLSDEHLDADLRNCIAVLVEHDLGDVHHAGWIHAPRTAVDDAAMWPGILMGCDRFIRPWLYSEPDPWPEFIPFPRLRRLAQWWSARRGRAR